MLREQIIRSLLAWQREERAIKIYLASRYGRKEELRAFRNKLHMFGHQVTSRWLDTEEDMSNISDAKRMVFALADLTDVYDAQCCLSFTEAANSGHSRGGRHVEFGYALHAQKRLILIGPRENLFHYHPSVEVYETEEACLAALDV